MMVVSSSKNKDEYLVLMQGGNVSSGMPSWRAWLKESPVIIYDRDIDYINLAKADNEILAMLQMTLAIDTKVQASNGKFWRYVGDSSEIITYDNVSEATAREFDDILETLCYYP